MKRRTLFFPLAPIFMIGTLFASEVTINPNVSWYDTNAASVLSIWSTGTGCEPLKADSINSSTEQVLFWTAQLIKAQELGLSVGVGYDASCNIIYIARMR